jgi:hypothetical protein
MKQKIIEMKRGADGIYRPGKETVKATPAKIRQSKKTTKPQRQPLPDIISALDMIEEIGERCLDTWDELIERFTGRR